MFFNLLSKMTLLGFQAIIIIIHNTGRSFKLIFMKFTWLARVHRWVKLNLSSVSCKIFHVLSLSAPETCSLRVCVISSIILYTLKVAFLAFPQFLDIFHPAIFPSPFTFQGLSNYGTYCILVLTIGPKEPLIWGKMWPQTIIFSQSWHLDLGTAHAHK